MLSFIIPTRDRVQRLKQTLEAISRLGACEQLGGAEVIVIDNDSRERLVLPARLRSHVPVRSIWLNENLGAASRNVGAAHADPRSTWLVMLDDDSWPVGHGLLDALHDQPEAVGAVSADIFLGGPQTQAEKRPRERGGLPEVFVGCGVAIRTQVFRALGGYDPTFHYYVEEYDLSAKLLLAGYRVRFDPRFLVVHAKDVRNRSMDLIVRRLTRNNAWIAQRYCPEADLARELREVRTRYAGIARKEHARAGYLRGRDEAHATLDAQPRTPMPNELWDRFTGLAHARLALAAQLSSHPGLRRVHVVDEGKNAWVVRRALRELGGEETPLDKAQALVVGSMSPGPMLDSYFARSAAHARPRLPVLLPWLVGEDAGELHQHARPSISAA